MSRGSVTHVKRVLWAIGVAVMAAGVLAAVIWLSAVTDKPGDAAASGDGDTAARSVERPAGAFPLTVRYVYDGDTIQAQMQAPNDIVTTAAPIRIRLIGIDTPEGTPTPKCWADEARSHLAELLPEGSTVWAAPDRDTWDAYDRRLFNVWSDDGTFVNLELVAAGDAEAIRIEPNVAYFDVLADAQARAEASGTGRWGACG